MFFHELSEGEYRIYAGAMDDPRGQGYIAALVVNRVRGDGAAPLEAYRDHSLACGYRWPSPEKALGYAMKRAREVIKRELQGLPG